MAIYFGEEKVAGNILNTRNVMTLYRSDRFSMNLSTSYQAVVIPMSEYIRSGDRLTYSNNGIKIGKGVSKVLVSGSIGMWQSPASGEIGLQIYRNNTRVAMRFGNHSNEIFGIVVVPTLVDVVEGDLIEMRFSSGATGTHNFLTDDKAVHLTVDVVE